MTNRGDRREEVFQSDDNRRLFLETLGQSFEEPVERGCCLRDEEFRRELLAAVDELADSQDTEVESAPVSAGQGPADGAGGADTSSWDPEELDRKHTGDPQKLLVAGRLSRETMRTLTWIADRLHMGAPGHVVHMLHWKGWKAAACENTLLWRPLI